MTIIYIICEGKTEAEFVKNVLAPVLAAEKRFVHPVPIGGNVTYSRLQRYIRSQLRNHRRAYCSTLFDYYGLDSEFPGRKLASTKSSLSDKAQAIQDGLQDELSRTIESGLLQRFRPYVQMHEFEALLFSDTDALAEVIGQKDLRSKFATIRQVFKTPEHIDDSPVSAPSKRILNLVPGYEKPLMGRLAATAIGLPKIRAECPLFNAWLQSLENLPPPPV